MSITIISPSHGPCLLTSIASPVNYFLRNVGLFWFPLQNYVYLSEISNGYDSRFCLLIIISQTHIPKWLGCSNLAQHMSRSASLYVSTIVVTMNIIVSYFRALWFPKTITADYTISRALWFPKTIIADYTPAPRLCLQNGASLHLLASLTHFLQRG